MTKAMRLTMTEQNLGEGERREQAQGRYRRNILSAVFVVGMLTGGYFGYELATNDFTLTERWPPVAAIVTIIFYLTAMLGGSLALARHMDELEKENNYKAAAFAGTVYILVYPVWFLLWKGGFVTEPIHWALFVLFWFAMAGAYLYYRFR